MLNRHAVRALLVFAGFLTAGACGSPTPSTAPPAAASTAPADTANAEVTGTARKGAIISLLPAAGEVPLPEGPAVMDQYAKQFVPNMLYVRVGQPVEFRNTEDMGHNVTVNRRDTGAGIFSVETDPQQKHIHTFDRVGQYDVTCSMHPGMQATVVATRSPVSTTVGDDGRFTLSGVPAGDYTLSVTFEGRTVDQAVAVKGPRTEVKVQ
ncbi:MAG: carboxypeptidase regulatory-like domain-containing protein [Acidobacteriota bacterium]|nr:carboxypeptidase regulatory-like domain-containing protein [Acidobacteriota bacterium]MDP3717747.1 carboxypeptidase regulatory-like domain-containing protein [Acidobacteriota bacterium]